MTHDKIRVIARGSRLSRIQVEEVMGKFPDIPYEIRYLDTYGDKRKDISLLNGEAPADIFTRELDDTLRQGLADIAVHSAKDLPYPLPDDIEVIALLPAFDTTDSLVSRDSLRLEDLPSGSVIGTSSPLRKKGLNALRPDLVVKGIRGCIEERVQQVREGKYDAAIVATCALKRLGMESEITEVLPFATHPLQGYLAVTALRGEKILRGALSSKTKNLLLSQGTVRLIGFGPGDPELLTVKAVKAIEQADIIFYDDLINHEYLESVKAEKVYVGKRAGYHHAEQADINRLMLDAARAGKEVVRLKGGDPMIFAHGSEEIAFLESNLVKVEVIPGVTTASAMVASLKVSFTHRDLSSSVALVSGHTSVPVTPDAETLVYYMGANRLRAIAAKLTDEGWALNTPVVLSYHVSHPDEQTFERTLGQLRATPETFPTPLIVMVGNVASLRHRQACDIKPTLYTGIMPPVEQRHPDYTYTPLIEIHPEHNPQAYLGFLHNSGKYDYLLFTSRHAVSAWLAFSKEYGAPTVWPRIISIGSTTTRALLEEGIQDVTQVEKDNSYGVLEWFEEERKREQRREKSSGILIPRSNLALPIIPDGLRAMGYHVETVTAYYNQMPQRPRRVSLNHYKRVVFTSPSTIDGFIRLYGGLPEDIEYVCRGPVTEAYLTRLL